MTLTTMKTKTCLILLILSGCSCGNPDRQQSRPANSTAERLRSPAYYPESDIDPALYVVGSHDRLPKFDAYVTWHYPEEGRGGDSVSYWWGGEYVGSGDQGMDNILAKVRQMPAHSIVLFFPVAQENGEGSGLPRASPAYTNYVDKICGVARHGHVTIVESERDNLGRIVPRR